MDWRHMQEMLQAGHAVYSELKNLCVWNKTNGGMGSFYRSKHELVFVWKSGNRSSPQQFRAGPARAQPQQTCGVMPGFNAFRAERMDELQMHPTVKPVGLVADAIRDCSRRGDLVLDPFLRQRHNPGCRGAHRPQGPRPGNRPGLCRRCDFGAGRRSPENPRP